MLRFWDLILWTAGSQPWVRPDPSSGMQWLGEEEVMSGRKQKHAVIWTLVCRQCGNIFHFEGKNNTYFRKIILEIITKVSMETEEIGN